MSLLHNLFLQEYKRFRIYIKFIVTFGINWNYTNPRCSMSRFLNFRKVGSTLLYFTSLAAYSSSILFKFKSRFHIFFMKWTGPWRPLNQSFSSYRSRKRSPERSNKLLNDTMPTRERCRTKTQNSGLLIELICHYSTITIQSSLQFIIVIIIDFMTLNLTSKSSSATDTNWY